FGAFSLLAGFFVLLFFGALGTAAAAFLPGEFGLLGGIFGVIGLFVAFFVFAFAVLTIVTGMGTLRGRRWAWTLMIVLMALNALRGLFGLADRDVGSLVTLAVSGVVIWYFFTPEVKQWFDRV
ncbi:MAG TPA: hypothetical protein VFH78_10170, partial [Candidatus Thermoplasmatota archaeon]|nr:hypothetical protein [Candidatus Thermoplasmatota archaeon]